VAIREGNDVKFIKVVSSIYTMIKGPSICNKGSIGNTIEPSFIALIFILEQSAFFKYSKKDSSASGGKTDFK
jgi:hypothetical protein